MMARRVALAAMAGVILLGCSSTGVTARTVASWEVVAEWNRLLFDLGDPRLEQQYLEQKLYRKVLMQGVKVDSRGELYVSTARWGGPEVPATLSRLVRRGQQWYLQPFPSLAMNRVGDPGALQAVLGFEIDRNDVMWILDQGHIAGAPSQPGAEKLILWDIRAGREIQRYVFPDSITDKRCSFLNDIVVDNDTGFAYITDSGIFCDPLKGGLIVYDSRRNVARRVLDSTVFTNDEAGFVFRINNRPVLKSAPMRTGADGIALSGDKRTLYWTNLTGNRLYAIDTALLRDFRTTEAELRTAIRLVAVLPSNTDGMTADRDGNLYMTALQLNGILYREASTGRISHLFIHPEMVWPDTLAWDAQGRLYVVSNHLHVWVDGDMEFEQPPIPNFRIWRLDLGPNPPRSYLAP